MRSIVYVLAAAALTGSLSGCGGESAGGGDPPIVVPPPSPPPPTPPPPPPPPPAALYQPPVNFQVGIRDGIIVRNVSAGRDIPIRVRYPSNFVPASGEKLPVIIWSHGGATKLNGHLNNNEWGDALAAAGYVVIHMGHLPRTNVETAALYTEFGLTAQQGSQCFIPDLVDRPRDALAVLRDLTLIESQVPNLPAPFDLARVSMAGHSFGSFTARTVSGARIDLCPNAATVAGFPSNWPFRSTSFRSEIPKVFLALSPQGPGQFGFFVGSWNGLNRPDMTLTGDGDITGANNPDDDIGQTPVNRIVGYQTMPAGDKWLMYISSTQASHNTFNLNNTMRPDFVDWTRSTGLAFMDTYMRNSTTARTWLSTNQLGLVSSNVARVETR